MTPLVMLLIVAASLGTQQTLAIAQKEEICLL